MTGGFTSALRALVVATLLCAIVTVMLVTVSRAHAAGASTIATHGELYPSR